MAKASPSKQPAKIFNPNYLLFIKRTDFITFSILAVSILLRWLIPANIVTNSPNDDLLGVQLAQHILTGNWLGPWSVNTLVKPAGYSIFLAICHILHCSPIMVIHILFLLSFHLFVRLVCRLTTSSVHGNRLLKNILLSFLIFNPALYGGDISRIYRVSLNALFSCYFAILVLYILSDLASRIEHNNWTNSIVKSRTYFIAIGFIYSFMVLTRAESYWVLYPAIFILITFLFYVLRARTRFVRLQSLKLISIGILFALMSYFFPISLVGQINQTHYGVNLSENMTDGEFNHALNLWEGVQDGIDQRPFISISKGQRLAVYAISENARSLKPFLETPPNTGWNSFNCQYTKVCDEAGAWFVWQIRDASVQSGKVTSEVTFQNFFKQIAWDISSACAKGTLKCGKAGTAPGVRNIFEMPAKQLINGSFSGLQSLFSFEAASLLSRPNNGDDPNQLAIWSSVITDKRVLTDGGNDWLALPQAVSFLTHIYSSIVYILFLLALLSMFASIKIHHTRVSAIFQLYLILSILLFCGGLSIFQIALGFQPGFSLYSISGNPYFMFFLSFGIINTYSAFITKEVK